MVISSHRPKRGFSPGGFSPSPIRNVENFIKQQALQCIGSVFHPLLSINGGQNPGGQNLGGQNPGKIWPLGQKPGVDFQGEDRTPQL